MSSNCNEITTVLLRGGTDQLSRTNTSLDPESVTLHGFGLKEWMEFAYNFAKDHVKFFEDKNGNESGTWEEFFKDGDETKKLLAELENSDELTPHLTLFICFLRLLEYSSNRMNGITKRHLDFYYKEVLQIETLPPQYDKVNLLFELSKNISQAKLDKGTLLNGGKDINGKQLLYQLSEDASVNTAVVDDIRNFYFDPDYINPQSNELVKPTYMKAGLVPKSTDGLGDALPEGDESWYGFGYNHERVDAPFTELNDAEVGFSIASKALVLSEGTRYVQFEINFDQDLDEIDYLQLKSSIQVQYTGEEEWVGPLSIAQNGRATTGGGFEYKSKVNTGLNQIKLLVTLDSGMPAVLGYKNEFHSGAYETTNPLFKFLVNSNSEDGLLVFRNFIKKITSINIEVCVDDMRNLVMESDLGSLNPTKPMFPFSTVPVQGSSFTIKNQEMFSKNWVSADLNILWKNTPSNFVTWYDAYRTTFKSSISKSIYEKGYNTVTNSFNPSTGVIVYNSNYFTAKRSLKVESVWRPIPSNKTLFSAGTSPRGIFTFDGTQYTDQKSEALRISLVHSFLHEMYTRLYTIALSSSVSAIPIPNEPYTPFAEEVTLSYKATDTISFSATDQESFEARENELYHEHPYGESLQHSYLKSALGFVTATQCTLLPDYCRGGELYLGINNADHLQNVSLLIQILEGSENKQVPSFTGGQKVSWHILAGNHWKELDSTLLSRNEIDNFLQSGIVTFKIPNEATTNNTILPSGKFWIRAKMHKSFDTVCQVLGVTAQVARAEFVDNDNELSHLINGLPNGTIKKLIERTSKIKGIEQPFNSYDGKPEENDEQYYRRVSERLRHKNRAITLWDYEHMVLQEFPELYKLKCLNHTSETSYTRAGSVTLIVVPDTVNKNVYNIFQPRVSTAFLNRVKNYVVQFTSMHVKLEVINPAYEEVTISLKVKFNTGLDEAVHKIELNKDLIRLLSPWAYDETKQVDFGNTLHRSVLINYIEELSYVDYIQDVTMSIDGGSSIENYSPTTPKSIMVSAINHTISTDIITCEAATQIITEECQH